MRLNIAISLARPNPAAGLAAEPLESGRGLRVDVFEVENYNQVAARGEADKS
jgi:hypothetical protein